jgi:hypothetical protein
VLEEADAAAPVLDGAVEGAADCEAVAVADAGADADMRDVVKLCEADDAAGALEKDTVMVTAIVLKGSTLGPGALREAGMVFVEVRDATGDAKEPDMPVRLAGQS